MLRGYKATLESLIQDTTSLVAVFISLERMKSDLGLPLDTQRNTECLAMGSGHLQALQSAADRYKVSSGYEAS